MEFKKYPSRTLNRWLSVPFIYTVIFPVIILDIFMELYHRICFPLYDLKYVTRGDYIVIDRYKLSYLDFFDKMNCLYCGYANGVLAYASKIAEDSEKYWCGIQHSRETKQTHQKDFAKYGDEEDLKKKYE